VTNVDAQGVAEFDFVPQRLRYSEHSPATDVVIDTSKPADAAPAGMDEQIREIASIILKLQSHNVMNDRGEVIKSTIDPSTQQIIQQSRARMLLERFLSEQTRRETLNNLFPAFPERAVKTGDSWQGEIVVNDATVNKQTLRVTYTLRTGTSDSGQRFDEIDSTTKLDFNPMIRQLAARGMTVDSVDQDQNGKMRFDASTGRPSVIEINEKMKMAGESHGAAIVQEDQSTTKITVSRPDP